MKKTVQVNLSGQVFTLDEDAFELLSGYLKQIGRLYERSAGKDEILSDIESRIAELFISYQSDQKEVISNGDVEKVIEIMGRPEQFEEDAEEPMADTNTSSSSSSSGGDYRSRRLYRDGDRPVIGGVCSGIAYYFGLDPIWIRLAFALSFIFFGTGFLLYIVLWIVIPEAKTTAEKLNMKGEPINIDSIGKKVESEIESFGERVSEASARYSRGSGKKIQTGIDKFFYFLAEILRGLFTVISKVLGSAFLLAGLAMIVFIFAAIFGVADVVHWSVDNWSADLSLYEWGDLVFNAGEWFSIAVIAVLLLVGMPFIGLAYGGALLLFPKARVPFLGASLMGLWFIGIVLAIFTGLGIAQEFSKSETIVDEISLTDMGVTADTLIVEVGNDPFDISPRRAYHANNDFLMRIDDDEITVGNVEFDVLPSHNDQFYLELRRSAQGKSFSSASENAEDIGYDFETDSTTIVLNPYFQFPQEDLLRAQEVEVTLRVPRGKTIFLSAGTKRIIEDIENVTDMYDPDMVNHYWEMKPEGLTCLDCDVEDDDEEIEDTEEWEDELEERIREEIEEEGLEADIDIQIN